MSSWRRLLCARGLRGTSGSRSVPQSGLSPSEAYLLLPLLVPDKKKKKHQRLILLVEPPSLAKRLQNATWVCCWYASWGLIGASSGMTGVSQFKSFSFSERERINRFFGVDELDGIFAGCSSLVPLPSEGFWVSADVTELLSEFWDNIYLVSAQIGNLTGTVHIFQKLKEGTYRWFICWRDLLKVWVCFQGGLRPLFVRREGSLEVLDEDQRECCSREKTKQNTLVILRRWQPRRCRPIPKFELLHCTLLSTNKSEMPHTFHVRYFGVS